MGSSGPLTLCQLLVFQQSENPGGQPLLFEQLEKEAVFKFSLET